MASGKELRRRITSVKSTQQITRAMKMVSAAKLRRAQDRVIQARPYAKEIKKVVGALAQDTSLTESSPLLAPRKVKKVNVVLLTSDRGLCGGFNSNLNKFAEKLYKEESGNFESFTFTCLGKKGSEYLKLRNVPIAKTYVDFYKDADFSKTAVLGEGLMESFLQGEFDELRLVYAEFKSALSQIIKQETLLPIPVSSGESESHDFIFEPNSKIILRKLLPRYFKSLLYRAVLESTASEHGARMAAMDSATTNAGEVIRKLTLLYNNVRQAGITSELLEITAGSEAL